MLVDGNDITYFALDQGRQAMEHCHPNKLEDPMLKSTCLHKWTYLQGTVYTLKKLYVLLQVCFPKQEQLLVLKLKNDKFSCSLPI